MAPAATGYFILDSGSLYMTTSGVFPHAQVRTPRDGMTVHQLLEQAKESWRWRTAQWAEGRIDVVTGTDLTDFQGPDGTLPVEHLGPWHHEHLVLLGGWEQ